MKNQKRYLIYPIIVMGFVFMFLSTCKEDDANDNGPEPIENSALKFNGQNDYVDIGDFGGYTNKATIEAWIKTSGAPGWRSVLGGDCEEIYLATDNNKLNFAAQCGSPLQHTVWSVTLFTDNSWHHVA